MHMLYCFYVFQYSDCKEDYNSLVQIPKSNDVSVGTIKGFFNAYLLHKYVVDYMVTFSDAEFVAKNWIYQINSTNFNKKLLKLQDVLNSNIQKLAQLVRNH